MVFDSVWQNFCVINFFVQLKLLNVIILGQTEPDYINGVITINNKQMKLKTAFLIKELLVTRKSGAIDH